MKREFFQEIRMRIDESETAAQEIRKLEDEKSKLPKKPPELFGKAGCFGVAALFAVLSLLLVLSETMRTFALINFVIAGLCLTVGFLLQWMNVRYEKGQIRRDEIEKNITEQSELRAQLKTINDAVFRDYNIQEPYQTRDAIATFERYCNIDENMSLTDMYARYESETIIREVLKTLCVVNERMAAIDKRVATLEATGQSMIGLLDSILSVGKNIDANLDCIRKNTNK